MEAEAMKAETMKAEILNTRALNARVLKVRAMNAEGMPVKDMRSKEMYAKTGETEGTGRRHWLIRIMVIGILMAGISFGKQGVMAFAGDIYTVSGVTNYLALRNAMAYDAKNEIGKLYNGETVEVMDHGNGTYWYVYSVKLGKYGYVNGSYLVRSNPSQPDHSNRVGRTIEIYTVTGTTNYLALRSAMAYDRLNEIGKLYNGEIVSLIDKGDGTYWYVYSFKLDQFGFVNSSYLSFTYPERVPSPFGRIISEDEAWDAILGYVDSHYDLDKVYDYHGWIVEEGITDPEYKYHMRSYTGVHIYFYLNVIDGNIYVQEQNPVTNEFEARTYVANAYDYIG